MIYVERDKELEDLFHNIFEKYDPNCNYKDVITPEFELRRFYWGCDHNEDDPCHKDCHGFLPNFKDVETGLEIKWYKYPLRAAEANQEFNINLLKVKLKKWLKLKGV